MSELVLRLGTRRSPLSLAQARQVAAVLAGSHPGVFVELVPITTRGDREPGDLSRLGGKGLFTAELERGLLAGDLDLAVHSLKDLPVRLPDGLAIAAFPPRGDPRDALVSEIARELDDLPPAAVLLTGSLRRRAQILRRRPDLGVEPLRGNVGTRLERWRRSGRAGVILAQAGLERLGLGGDEVPAHPLDPESMVPAPGQGTLAVEVARGGRAERLCRALDHPPTARAARAERSIVRAFGGDCALPLAAWAREAGGELWLTALVATPDGRRAARGEGRSADPAVAVDACLKALRDAGAEEIVAALR